MFTKTDGSIMDIFVRTFRGKGAHATYMYKTKYVQIVHKNACRLQGSPLKVIKAMTVFHCLLFSTLHEFPLTSTSVWCFKQRFCVPPKCSGSQVQEDRKPLGKDFQQSMRLNKSAAFASYVRYGNGRALRLELVFQPEGFIRPVQNHFLRESGAASRAFKEFLKNHTINFLP